MKIAILFESLPSGGGAFTHSLNATLDLIRFFNRKNEFVVFTNSKENLKTFENFNIKSEYFHHTFFDKLIIYLSTLKFFRFIFQFLNIQIYLEKKIINQSFNLIFFPVLSSTIFSLKKVKFVSTLLDLEHFKHSIFPEITTKDYEYREKLHFYALPKSLLIITSYASIKNEMCRHYSINKNKVIIIPYTPGRFLKSKNLKLKKYQNFKNYFFYPAQIWGHKNHIVILKAMSFLKEKYGLVINLILSGRDRGYKKILMKYIKKNKLYKNVIFTGYVSSKEMDYLYQKCKCVIFTSLFGPNAIPPLEAWKYKKPIIINEKLKDVKKNNGFLVNVRNHRQVATYMRRVFLNQYPKKLIKSGNLELKKIEKENKKRYKFLEQNIKKKLLNS